MKSRTKDDNRKIYVGDAYSFPALSGFLNSMGNEVLAMGGFNLRFSADDSELRVDFTRPLTTTEINEEKNIEDSRRMSRLQTYKVLKAEFGDIV